MLRALPSSSVRAVPPPARQRLGLAAWALALGLATTAGGCQLPPPGELAIYPADAPELARASVDPETGSWQSAPWASGDVEWLPYPPQGRLQLEHGLGRTPTSVLVYLSFEPSGASPALAAGDMARVLHADGSSVTVWNATNGSYFARVVVH